MWKVTSEFPYFVPQWRKYRGDRTDVGSGDAKTSQTRRSDVFVVLVVLHGVMTASWRFTTCKLAVTSWGIRKKVRYCGAPPTVQRLLRRRIMRRVSLKAPADMLDEMLDEKKTMTCSDICIYGLYILEKRCEKTYSTLVSFSIMHCVFVWKLTFQRFIKLGITTIRYVK